MTRQQILFSLDGRIKRSTYWTYALLLSPVWIGSRLIDFAYSGKDGIFFFLGTAICFWPAVALNVKRCHDRDRSGWFYLVAFIPLVNLWYLVEIGFFSGTPGRNRFDMPGIDGLPDVAAEAITQ